MVKCDICGTETGLLPFNCKRCDGYFCVEHHLPEEHECSAFFRKDLKENDYQGFITETKTMLNTKIPISRKLCDVCKQWKRLISIGINKQICENCFNETHYKT